MLRRNNRWLVVDVPVHVILVPELAVHLVLQLAIPVVAERVIRLVQMIA